MGERYSTAMGPVVTLSAPPAIADPLGWNAVLAAARYSATELSVLLAQSDLRAPAAATRLGMGRSQFWRLVKLYRIPHVRHSARCVTFRAIDIEAYKRWRLVTDPQRARRMTDGRRSS